MQSVMLIAVAGAVGALGRYGLGSLISGLLGKSFPYGTLCVNILGCLLIGFLMHLALTTDLVAHHWRQAIIVGFLGAFTTFSTFSYETVKLIEEGLWPTAAVNIGMNVASGLIATIVGLAIARTIFGSTA